jgi:phosphotriesterase-related protein
MPTTDEQHVDQIKRLIEHGHLNRILLSHDFVTNGCMPYAGGPGYAHIPKIVIPIMRAKGLSEVQIHEMTADNPAQALSIS